MVTAGAEGRHPSRRRREHAPAHKITPVDTTGAGDTFVGVLAAGIADELAFAEALARACYGASLACLALGAQAAMPMRSAIENWRHGG